MKNLLKVICFFPLLLLLISGCNQKKAKNLPGADILFQNQYQLTQVIIYDVFTPPVASRIYLYSSLASYEAIKFVKPGYTSITAKLNDFKPMPVPEKGKPYNFTLAATRAFFTVVHKLVFSIDSLNAHEVKTYSDFENSLDKETYNRSLSFGESIGDAILARAKDDGYIKSRGKPKYLGSEEPGKWRPTPPDYLDGVEWCWNTMKSLTLDSSSQCIIPRPPVFSTDTNSVFYKGLKEVYTINKNLTEEQKLIATYWDDNPFVIEHSGHLMFGNKKITPGGHWMGIADIACKQSKADEVKTAQTYAITSIALFDAFIASWDEKYRSSFVRPVTVINEILEKGWPPFLQTPPFPEYPSGHSAITRSAATVLTKLYGNNFAFQDTSDLHYIGLQRHFDSFVQAADEASISRLLGGIHFRLSVDEGAEQGKMVGEIIIKKLGL